MLNAVATKTGVSNEHKLKSLLNQQKIRIARTPLLKTNLLLLSHTFRAYQKKIKRVFNKYGVATVFKPHQTLRQLLVAPKDKPREVDKSGVVYRVPCKECDRVYVGETKRTLGERLKEHSAKNCL